MQEINYKGVEIPKWQDPCLTCENYGKEEDCCCKKWEDYEEQRLNDIFEEYIL